MFYMSPKEYWFVRFKSSRQMIFANRNFNDTAFVIYFNFFSCLKWVFIKN